MRTNAAGSRRSQRICEAEGGEEQREERTGTALGGEAVSLLWGRTVIAMGAYNEGFVDGQYFHLHFPHLL